MKKLLLVGAGAGLLYALSQNSSSKAKKDEIWNYISLKDSEGDKIIVSQILQANISNEIDLLHKLLFSKDQTLSKEETILAEQMRQKYEGFLGNPLVVGSVLSKLLPTVLVAGIGLYAFNQITGATDGRWETKNYEKQWFTDEWGYKYNAIDLARQYYNSLDGAGTYETTLMTLAKASRGSRWGKIGYAYRKMYGETLNDALKGDLNEYYLNNFESIRQNVPSPNSSAGTTHYEFGIGESVDVKSMTTSYKYAVKNSSGKEVFRYDTFWFTPGKITGRKQLRGEGSNSTYDNYYKTEGYPDYYIIGAALERDI